MNQNNNNYNEKEIKNKLKNFKEGADYSVSPTEEPNIKTYSFFNEELKSWFRSDRVPVRVTKEAYDGKDYTYRGHFEEGEDYYYSHQNWEGNPPTDEDGWRPIMSEFYSKGNGDWLKQSARFRGLGNSSEPKKTEPNHDCLNDCLEPKLNQLVNKLNSLLARPESDFGVDGKEKKECEIAEVKKDIANIEREIEKRKSGSVSHQPDWIRCGVCDKTFNKNTEVWGVQDDSGFEPTCCYDCAKKLADKCGGRIIKRGSDEYFRRDPQQKGRMGRGEKGSWADNSNLEKENQELRQQLTEVQKQLAGVLKELKKLKSNINGKGGEKLEQQIVKNEKLIKDSENISVAEVQEQVNKSEALMNELNTNVSENKDNKGNGSLPYVIGGSVILAVAGIVGYLVVKKGKRK